MSVPSIPSRIYPDRHDSVLYIVPVIVMLLLILLLQLFLAA